MTTLPKIAIQICTYDRPEEIVETLTALWTYLDYPRDRIKLYVSDDASPKGYIPKLKKLAVFKEVETDFIVMPENGGWGRNVNTGLRMIQEDIIFFLEDDYVLEMEFDLRIGVGLLATKSNVGMLRYRGTAGSHLVMHQFEGDLSNYKSDSAFPSEWLEGSGSVPWKVTYLQIDGGSPDLWIYSNGPHLKHRRFHEFYGLYPEGVRLGETEERFAHQVKDLMMHEGAPGIAILPDWVVMRWDHIGKSYQFGEKDNPR